MTIVNPIRLSGYILLIIVFILTHWAGRIQRLQRKPSPLEPLTKWSRIILIQEHEIKTNQLGTLTSKKELRT